MTGFAQWITENWQGIVAGAVATCLAIGLLRFYIGRRMRVSKLFSPSDFIADDRSFFINKSLSKEALDRLLEADWARTPVADSPAAETAEVEQQDDDLPERIGEEVFVRVHYATDRALSGQMSPNHYYGSERGDLRYGQALVSIPVDHTMGYIERPSLWRIQIRENPENHVVLREIDELDHVRFFEELNSEIMHTKGNAAFVFIHGFNVTFAAAARRAAQIAYDLFLIGQQRGLATLSTVPILYSWPSKGGLFGAADYFHDAADSEASGGGHLRAFLNDVARLSGAASITVVAHSMGTRALATALSHIGLGMPPDAKPLVKEIILAAPDIDRDVFLNIADAVTRAGERTTMYASDRVRIRSRQSATSVKGRERLCTAGRRHWWHHRLRGRRIDRRVDCRQRHPCSFLLRRNECSQRCVLLDFAGYAPGPPVRSSGAGDAAKEALDHASEKQVSAPGQYA
jgi:esterase/lipase superfamily enzyme